MTSPRYFLRNYSASKAFRNSRFSSQKFSKSQRSATRMPECEFRFEEYKGRTYESVLAVHKKHVFSSLYPYYARPVMLVQGRMQWVWDIEGKRYLDLLGGVATVNVGHCNSKVNEKAKIQIDKLWHTTSNFITPSVCDYIEKLTATLSGELKVCYLVNSGSEANDFALQLARSSTGAFDAIALMNAYHGSSPYTIGLCGNGAWKHNVANGFGIHHAMNPDPYHGVWGGSHCRDSLAQTDRVCSCDNGKCNATDEYVVQLEELLRNTVPPKIAAFVAEPIQGVGDIVQYTKGYLKKAFDLVRSRGGLCISDEVQTGFGRLGSHRWGFEAHGVVPDIIALAKGIGNGFPFGAVITTQKIADSIKDVAIFNTFGGNSVACTVAGAVLDIIEEENTQQRCVELGDYFLSELKLLRQKHDVVGDVRGKGLMIGVELVDDKATRSPLVGAKFDRIFEEIKDLGVVVGKGGPFGNVLRILPAFCVTKDDIDFAVAIFDLAFQSHHDMSVQE